MEKVLKSKLLKEADFLVEEFIGENFDKESFGGKKWPARKKSDVPGGRRALLVQTGEGKRSVRTRIRSNAVEVVTDRQYMSAHNEGATINHPGGTPYIVVSEGGRTRVRFMRKDGSYPKGAKFTKAHKIVLPERRYIGDHPLLRSRLQDVFSNILQKHIKSILKP